MVVSSSPIWPGMDCPLVSLVLYSNCFFTLYVCNFDVFDTADSQYLPARCRQPSIVFVDSLLGQERHVEKEGQSVCDVEMTASPV
jgi:hypothetical protein